MTPYYFYIIPTLHCSPQKKKKKTPQGFLISHSSNFAIYYSLWSSMIQGSLITLYRELVVHSQVRQTVCMTELCSLNCTTLHAQYLWTIPRSTTVHADDIRTVASKFRGREGACVKVHCQYQVNTSN